MSNVVEYARRLGELQDQGVVQPREAKRLAGYSVIDAMGAGRQSPNTWYRDRVLSSVLLRTVGLQFSPSQASNELAIEVCRLVDGGYVNPDVNRSAGGFDRFLDCPRRAWRAEAFHALRSGAFDGE